VLKIVSGSLALAEGVGAVVKEAIAIVAPLEAAYITSGLVLVPVKAVGYALALAVDAVHALGAALSGVGFLFMNLVLTPLDLFNEGLGKALNFIHAGLGDGLVQAGKDGEAALQRIAAPALAFIKDIQTGNTAVQQFGKNWQSAQQDATSAAAAIQKAITDAVNAVANFRLHIHTDTGDSTDAVANAEAAAQIIGAAVDTEKAKLKSALDAGQLSYKQYFDALTAIEIASLDAQIRAKQAALAAATKPDERAKAEGEIAKLEEQEQAVRLKNVDELRAKQAANTDQLIVDDERERKAHGDTYASDLAAIGKIVEAHDLANAKAGASDAQRRASNQELLTSLTQQLDVKDDQAQAEQLLTSIEQRRRLIDAELKDDAITQVEAKQRLQALATQDVPRLQQQLDIIRQIADALHDPKLQNLVIKLTLEMEGVDLNLETDQQKEFTRLKDQ